ncbi:MAG: prolipoprotein diacylglyceryl transferase [Proteobacteria bacterium]|nr:prolipoprotein diacylglyceryl transferase [Pseudomonadota bacterium]
MTTQTSWFIHDLNPIAFSIGGEAVPWYWLNYLFGFFWCFMGLRFLAKKSPSSYIDQDDMTQFAVWSWFGMLLGARLTYILLYNLKWFKENPDQIVAIWNGGMSFHGGLIGVAIAAWLTSHIRRASFFTFTDRLATLIAWPLATGRICNFINGELPGRPTGVAWAVMFPEPWNDFPRHPSQLYEALTEGVLLGLLMLWAYPRWHRISGALSAIFLAGYGSLRFLTEFSREPDPQLGFLLPGFTMGQLLCILMLVCAIFIASRLSSQSRPND